MKVTKGLVRTSSTTCRGRFGESFSAVAAFPCTFLDVRGEGVESHIIFWFRELQDYLHVPHIVFQAKIQGRGGRTEIVSGRWGISPSRTSLIEKVTAAVLQDDFHERQIVCAFGPALAHGRGHPLGLILTWPTMF